MNEERAGERGPALGRWVVLAAMLLIGLILYFLYAPRSEPPVRPAATEMQ